METLDLIKEDFTDTEFSRCDQCAIEKAYFRVTGFSCFERVTKLTSLGKSFTHDYYGVADFESDKEKATEAKNGEVIRTIHLTKL